MASTVKPGSIGSSRSPSDIPADHLGAPARTGSRTTTSSVSPRAMWSTGWSSEELLDQPHHLLGLVPEVLGRSRQVEQATERLGVDVVAERPAAPTAPGGSSSRPGGPRGAAPRRPGSDPGRPGRSRPGRPPPRTGSSSRRSCRPPGPGRSGRVASSGHRRPGRSGAPASSRRRVMPSGEPRRNRTSPGSRMSSPPGSTSH